MHLALVGIPIDIVIMTVIITVNVCVDAACGVLQERLKNQKAEAASNPEYGKTYKPQTSKADKQAKRKQILSNIGEFTTHVSHNAWLKAWVKACSASTTACSAV